MFAGLFKHRFNRRSIPEMHGVYLWTGCEVPHIFEKVGDLTDSNSILWHELMYLRDASGVYVKWVWMHVCGPDIGIGIALQHQRRLECNTCALIVQ
ncbi:hypothetical protein ACLKA7_015220 [Drosophila subpalustris]